MFAPASLHVRILDRWVLNASRPGGSPLKVFAGQRSIDAEGSASTFRGRYDHQLHIFDDVAGHEHTRNTGRLVLSALDPPVAGKLTPECCREL
jgi:hypothetical protein